MTMRNPPSLRNFTSLSDLDVHSLSQKKVCPRMGPGNCNVETSWHSARMRGPTICARPEKPEHMIWPILTISILTPTLRWPLLMTSSVLGKLRGPCGPLTQPSIAQHCQGYALPVMVRNLDGFTSQNVGPRLWLPGKSHQQMVPFYTTRHVEKRGSVWENLRQYWTCHEKNPTSLHQIGGS